MGWLNFYAFHFPLLKLCAVNVNLSNIQFFGEHWESNPGPLGKKQESYPLCYAPPPSPMAPLFFCNWKCEHHSSILLVPALRFGISRPRRSALSPPFKGHSYLSTSVMPMPAISNSLASVLKRASKRKLKISAFLVPWTFQKLEPFDQQYYAKP